MPSYRYQAWTCCRQHFETELDFLDYPTATYEHTCHGYSGQSVASRGQIEVAFAFRAPPKVNWYRDFACSSNRHTSILVVDSTRITRTVRVIIWVHLLLISYMNTRVLRVMVKNVRGHNRPGAQRFCSTLQWKPGTRFGRQQSGCCQRFHMPDILTCLVVYTFHDLTSVSAVLKRTQTCSEWTAWTKQYLYQVKIVVCWQWDLWQNDLERNQSAGLVTTTFHRQPRLIDWASVWLLFDNDLPRYLWHVVRECRSMLDVYLLAQPMSSQWHRFLKMAHFQCLVRTNSELKGWKHCWIKRVSIWQISWQEIHMWARSLISSSMTGTAPFAAEMTKFTGFALCIHGMQVVVEDKIHEWLCPWNTTAKLFYSPANLTLVNNGPLDQAHRRWATRSYNKSILYRLYNNIQRSTNTILSRSYISDDLQSIVNVLWFNRREYTEQQSNSDSRQWTKIYHQARLSKSSGMARWTRSIDQFGDYKRRAPQKFTFNVDKDFSTPQRHASTSTLWKHNESSIHVRCGRLFQHEKCIFDNEVVTLMLGLGVV